jgi:hypothetical protein
MRWGLGFELGQRVGRGATLSLALIGSLAFASAATAETPTHSKRAHAAHVHKVHHGGQLGYLPLGASERGEGYQELSGDPDSGVGFYPLPYRYRVGAWRYHMREASVPPFIRNGVLYAMTMDRYRYNTFWAAPPDSWRYGVYDPFDGVGTPFSGGYYGPAAGDEDEPAFPFGRPYDH